MRDYPSQISKKKKFNTKDEKIFEEKKETKKYIISIKKLFKKWKKNKIRDEIMENIKKMLK